MLELGTRSEVQRWTRATDAASVPKGSGCFGGWGTQALLVGFPVARRVVCLYGGGDGTRIILLCFVSSFFSIVSE